MPEICGIISSAELNIDQRAGWESMRHALSRSIEGRTESHEQPWAAISIVAHHSNDSATLIHHKERKSIFALIGCAQSDHASSNSTEDHPKLNLNSDQFFIDFESPFAARR